MQIQTEAEGRTGTGNFNDTENMPAPVYKPGTCPKPATPRGRPCLLTKECEAKLLSAIESGLPLKQAAMFAGVSYDTLNRWRIRGKAENAPEEFRHFCKALERSEAIAMLRHVSNISDAGKTDWRASAWLLERRHPDDFAKPQQVEHSGPKGGPIAVVPEVEPEVLRRIKKHDGVKRIMAKLAALIEEKRRIREAAEFREAEER